MSEPQAYTDLEISILHHAEELIREEFKIVSDRFFHYTTQDAADAIISSQEFHSSFIRSSSDSLEFANPMAACRDWVCLEKRLFDPPRFPVELFKHFNEETSDPTARAYFISLSGDPDSKHLRSMYGNVPIGLKINTDATDFKSYGFFLKCKYVEDTKVEAFRLMDRWKSEVFERAITEHKIPDPGKIMRDWFYTLMQFCNTISLGIKQKAFIEEDETRIVVVPLTPDQATHWHGRRDSKPLSARSLIKREFLPLKLGAMGIVASVEQTGNLK